MKVIYSYTRKQAIEDGVQIPLNESHNDALCEAGIKWPVFMTTEVYVNCVRPWDDGIEELAPCQDPSGRLWDILTMMKFAIRRADGDRLRFLVMVVPNIPAGSKRHPRPKQVELLAVCGPIDIDNPEASITIMYPGQE
jgi:hypothetical protein